MITAGFCPTCHKPLPPDAPMGLCPDCLLSAGFGTVTGDAETFSAFQPPPPEELAEHFPQLEILSLIGRGGMGAVYKARQKRLDRMVALKILPPGIGERAGFAERFEREAKALAKLHHPHIVTLYEFGQTGRGGVHTAQSEPSEGEDAAALGLYYFLMEYVDGVNLRQLLSTGRVSPQEALAIVPQICEALQFAHDRGIVHRDIKPENILLNKEGRVKIADFGVAKIVSVAAVYDGRTSEEEEESQRRSQTAATGEEGSDLTEAGKVMGTPSYMAPEQIAHPGAVDHRADIYALGVVFYQMLTGELPAKRIEAPSRKVHVDVRLDEVVLRALEKDPELRYQEANLFKTQVETIAGTSPLLQTDVPRQSRTAGGLLKSDRGRLTWEKDTDIAMIAPSTGTIELFEDKLIVSTGAVRKEIPLDTIRSLQEAVPPAWWSPSGHRYLAVGYDAEGQRRTIAFLACSAIFRMVGETKRCAAEWLGAIQRAAKSATGREIEVLPGIQRLPLAVTPVAYLWLLPLIPMAVSLFATLMSAGRLSPGEALLAHFFPVFAPLLIAAGVLIQRALSMDSGMIRAPETETEPRFSRAAIVGAGWAAFVPLHFLKPVWMDPAWRNSAFGGLLMGLAIFVALMAWTSVICTTVLGWIAVSQIRRSDGKLHGLWLAVFDGLLFPLLAVDAAVVLPVWSLTKLTPYHGPAPFWIILAMGLAATTLIIANVFLVRWVWRAVNGTPKTDALPAIESWLGIMDAGDYARTWDTAAPMFQTVAGKDEWIGRCEKVRRPLGKVVSRRLHSGGFSAAGRLFTAKFATEFENLVPATETATFSRQADGGWKAFTYIVRSNKDLASGWKLAFWIVLGALLLTTAITTTVNIATSRLGRIQSQGEPSATFGPVVERVIPQPAEGVPCVLDFETGKLLTPPDAVAKKLEQGQRELDEEMLDWLQPSGGDAVVIMPDATSVRLFQTTAAKASQNLRDLPWDEVTAELVARVWSGTSAQRKAAGVKGLHFSVDAAPSPVAQLFVTREGSMGVLEVLGPSYNPRGVKIRYKLAQISAAIPPLPPGYPKDGSIPLPPGYPQDGSIPLPPGYEHWQEASLPPAYKQLQNDSAAQMPADSVPAAPPSLAFGPVIERYIPLPDTRGKGAPCVLDFETGELLLPPDKIRVRLAGDRDSIGQPTYDWMRNSHADASAGIAELRLFEGWGYGVKANGSFLRFDEFTPDDVFKAMKDAVAQKKDTHGERKPFIMSLHLESDAYAFLTREGTLGVMEVRSQGDGRTGLKIRYKLVQGGAAIPTNVPETPAFTARFAQGNIQLLAVSRIAPASGDWWLPDGTTRPEPFEINWRHTEPDDSIAALLLQKRGFPDGSAFFYKFAPDSCTLRGSSTPVTFHGNKLPGCEAVFVNVPAQDAPNALKQFTARIGVVSGEGTVILTHAAQGSGGYDTNLPDGTRFHLMSAEPVEGNDFVSLSYSHSPLENWSVRITAVDHDGMVHGAAAIQSTSGGQMGQTQARFEGLRLSAIKEFRFEVRQYQWMEFRDIALLPGERTPFQVVEVPPE